jgi:membrane-associated phospholipid phosphatase
MKRAMKRIAEPTERKGILMRHKFLIPLLLIVIFASSPCGSIGLFAQDLAPRDTVREFRYNLSQFGHETVRFLVQPTKWDGTDWLRIGVMGGATFLAMQADIPIRDLVLKDRRYFYSVPIEGARMYGELYSPVVFFVGFAAHSLIADDKSTRKIAYEIGQASLYTGAIVLTMKTMVGRARPHTNDGRAFYRPFTLFGDDYHSLPGGHSATTFVISTVLSRNIQPTWLKVLVYVPAVVTAFSRVYQDWHWTSDDLLGGALGYFVATWVVDLHEQKDSRVHVSSLFPLTISIDLN